MYISDHLQTSFFYLGRFLKKLADNQSSSINKDSILQYETAFYHLSGLTWNWMFNGSIYHVRYLHILHFYFVWENYSDNVELVTSNWDSTGMEDTTTCLPSTVRFWVGLNHWVWLSQKTFQLASPCDSLGLKMAQRKRVESFQQVRTITLCELNERFNHILTTTHYFLYVSTLSVCFTMGHWFIIHRFVEMPQVPFRVTFSWGERFHSSTIMEGIVQRPLFNSTANTSRCGYEFVVTMSQYCIISEGIVQRLPLNTTDDL